MSDQVQNKGILKVPVSKDGTLPSEEEVRKRIADNNQKEKPGFPDDLVTATVKKVKRKGTLCGVEIRTKSAGFMRLLQLAESPFYHGCEMDQLDSFEFMLAAFCLIYPETEELVRYAYAGELRARCDIWLLDFEQSEILEFLPEIAEFLEQLFEEYATTGEGDESDETAGEP